MELHHKTLALAESCTGGYMASQITALPGASTYFLGSLVVYSNYLKQSLLGVSPQTLETEGAVSRQTVQEMWQGLIQATGADYGIAVTGIAGPTGATPGKPLGTVWYALGSKEKKPEVGILHLTGDRQAIIRQAADQLFERLSGNLG